MLFSNKEWISHQLRNNEQVEHDDYFLSSTKRGQVFIEDIIERQPKKKRWALKVDNPQNECSKISSRAQKQRLSQKMLDENELAKMKDPAEQSTSCPALEPAESFQGLLGASKVVASSLGTHASGTAVPCSTEEMTDRSSLTPDGESEGFWFNTDSPELYFQTGIEI